MKEITLFGKALKASTLSFKLVNEVANKKGYIIHPDCCNDRVMAWLETLPNNVNSTFYKNWNDVISKDRFELFIDQIMHYMSTYGTNFEGKPYIPNDEPTVVDYTDYKTILPITIEEIGEKIQTLLNSGIALNGDTIQNCLSLVQEFNIKLDIETIKNKEAKMYLCLELDILPSKPEEMVRFLVYLYTNQTLLIKDHKTIHTIKSNKIDITKFVTRFGIEKLATVFHRFKPLFLAMKQGNEATINKLRKLANKHHKPYEASYFETLLSGKSDLSKLEENLKFLSNYKKVSLLQTIKVRQENTGILPILVRNQKLFVKEHVSENKGFYSLVYDMIYSSLIESLSKKACKIKLHPTINLALPTSEKSFIGTIPFGSYVTMSDVNSVVGINWKEKDGARDLDLSLLDIDGSKVGWNSDYYNDDNSVVYSGDMTSANPEATELLYCKKQLPKSVVRVNRYCGDENSKFNLFFAKTNNDYTVEENKMVNPNDIVFSTQLEMTSKEMLCGIITEGKFQFANIRTSNKRVSNGSDITTNYIKHCDKTNKCYLDLKTVLNDAGYEFVKKDADIDLSIVDKSTLIGLLAE